jgi:hypothetical protein
MREFFSWFTSGVLSDENGPGQPILPHGSIYQLGVRGVKISSQVSVRGRRFQRFLVARMSAQPGKERCPKFFDVDLWVAVTASPPVGVGMFESTGKINIKSVGQECPTHTIRSSPLPQLFPDLDKFLN